MATAYGEPRFSEALPLGLGAWGSWPNRICSG